MMAENDTVYGWCYSRRFDDWNWLFLYRKVRSLHKKVSQWIAELLFFTSGFMSKNRGLHWDRRLYNG